MTRQREIHAFPQLDPCSLRAPAAVEDPVLSGPKVRLYASGRAALYRIIASRSFPPDSVILLPAFHCGVEVEAVVRAGCRPDFYRIGKNLDIDVLHLRKKLSVQTRAILVTHFFGFPQELDDIREICRRRDILLIEDCAHALYARDKQSRWLGTHGDYALFSMRKTVFMPNGGAARVNRNGFALPDRGRRFNSPAIYKSAFRSVLEQQASQPGFFGRTAERVLDLHKHAFPSASIQPGSTLGNNPRWYYDVAAFDYEHDIAPFSKLCLKGLQPEQIIARRRHNYEQLATLLRPRLARQLVFSELPDGACPLCLPLFAEQRDLVVEKLADRKIMPFVFGRHLHPLLDTAAFPEAAQLSGSILGLPVHQQLTDQDLATIADTLCSVLEI